jgi:hypothetical protein
MGLTLATGARPLTAAAASRPVRLRVCARGAEMCTDGNHDGGQPLGIELGGRLGRLHRCGSRHRPAIEPHEQHDDRPEQRQNQKDEREAAGGELGSDAQPVGGHERARGRTAAPATDAGAWIRLATDGLPAGLVMGTAPVA